MKNIFTYAYGWMLFPLHKQTTLIALPMSYYMR